MHPFCDLSVPTQSRPQSKAQSQSQSQPLRPTLALRLRNTTAFCRARMAEDAFRLPVQTVAAVLLAFVWMRWRQMPEISWGAFSALFVVRASVEGTVGEASARVLGALIGVVLGVSMVLAADAAGASPVWAIVVGVACAAYLSMRWPMLSYSLVTVTILTVTPDGDILGGALDKTLAIAVGSASGILAALAVLPLSARYSARWNLAASIDAYGDMLVDWAAAFNEARQRPRLHDRPIMERARWRARDMVTQAGAFPLDKLSSHLSVYQLNERIEGLWRTAPIMERAGSFVLSERTCHALGPALHDVAAALKEQIGCLTEALREKAYTQPCHVPASALSALDAAIEEALHWPDCDAAEKQAIGVIRWIWQEVAREVEDLAGYLLEGRPDGEAMTGGGHGAGGPDAGGHDA